MHRRAAFSLAAPVLKLSEADVSQQIKDWLKVRRWHVERQQSGFFPVGQNADGSTRFLRVGQKGKSDFVAWRPVSVGVMTWRLKAVARATLEPVAMHAQLRGLVEMFFYEVKAPGKKPTTEQVKWLTERGVEGFLADWFDSLESFTEWYRHHFTEAG